MGRDRVGRSFVRNVPNSEDGGRYLRPHWETAAAFVFPRQLHTGIARKSRMSPACGTPLNGHLGFFVILNNEGPQGYFCWDNHVGSEMLLLSGIRV